MTDRKAMQQALEALELLAWYENPATKVQVRKPRNGGPIVTMYPHKVATEAAAPLRERLAQPEQDPVCAHGIGKTKCSFCHQPQPEQEPVAHTLNCVCGAVWDVSPDGVEEMVHAPNPPQRKPLTEKRIEELYSFWVVDCQDIVGFARAVERTVKGEA